jgi:thioredoxin 1
MVQQVSTLSDFHKVTAKGSVVIDFMTGWCGPCRQIAPKIDELARSNTNVSFYKVDIDEASELATVSKVGAVPTFHFFKDGSLVGKVVGADFPAVKKNVQRIA